MAAGAKPGWLPLAGNWNGSGGDEVGLYDAVARKSHFYSLTGSVLQSPFIAPSAPATWRPLAGDWNGDGTSSVGLYDPIGYTFYLNKKTDGSINEVTVVKVPAVPVNWIPLVGL